MHEAKQVSCEQQRGASIRVQKAALKTTGMDCSECPATAKLSANGWCLQLVPTEGRADLSRMENRGTHRKKQKLVLNLCCALIPQT